MNQITEIEMERERLAEKIRERFGLQSDLMQIPILAQIVGIKKATLYSHARAGKLFLPCRYVNSIALVRLDDLVAWMLAEADLKMDAK